MATPIQYTPQYIPTDLGMMQGMLDKRQQEYDAGFAAPLMFEDQFAQIEVSPENMAGKQAVLGNFQSKVQETVDRYGGDYGAASRDIARAIAKERQNPFYQMAPQHAEALKRQQMLTDKYGANAMVLNEVPRTFVDEQGRVQDINLTPTVLNQMDLERSLATEFGHLGKQVRESGLRNVEGRPGILEATTTRGITRDEVGDVSQQMMERLYNMNPDLAKAVDAGDPRAMQIAENMANQLVGGHTREFRNDPSYVPDTGKVDPTSGLKNYIVSTAPSTKTQMSPLEAKVAVDDYIAAKKLIDNTPVGPYGGWVDPTDPYARAEQSKYASARTKATRAYEKAIKPFQGPMLDELINGYGLSEEEAIQVVAREQQMRPVTHPNRVRPTAVRSKDAIIEDLSLSLRNLDLPEVDIYDKQGNKKTKSKEKFEKRLKKDLSDGKINNVEFDLGSGKIVLHTPDESYGIPSSSLGNKAVSEAIGGYNQIIKTLYGETANKTTPVIVGNNVFTAKKEYNPELGLYESSLYVLDPVNQTKQKVTEEQFNDAFFTGLFSTYGTQAQYKPSNIN